MFQPPSGGCVLKRDAPLIKLNVDVQPPSGGCVLKPLSDWSVALLSEPAAFGRLCVETSVIGRCFIRIEPAAFGRLCVETCTVSSAWILVLPAAFGRLCVETIQKVFLRPLLQEPAAFGRLCVETAHGCAWLCMV